MHTKIETSEEYGAGPFPGDFQEILAAIDPLQLPLLSDLIICRKIVVDNTLLRHYTSFYSQIK